MTEHYFTLCISHLTCTEKKDFQLSGMQSQYSKREQKRLKDIHNL